MSSAHTSNTTSILALVVDVTPLAWGERDVQRSAQDKARFAAGKRSRGPCTLEELLTSLQAFVAAFTSLYVKERERNSKPKRNEMKFALDGVVASIYGVLMDSHECYILAVLCSVFTENARLSC